MSFSDNDIILRCQKGDQTAFSHLYDAYIDSIYKFIYLKVFDKEIAEDITSDVFLKVFKKLDTYRVDGEASFKTWIYKVAYNTVIDYFRTKKEQTDIEDVVEMVGYQTDFGGDIDNKDRVAKILLFLDTQPEKVRKILVMRFWDELSFKEIAEITGESLDNCKKIVSRTLQKMDPTMFSLFLLLLAFYIK